MPSLQDIERFKTILNSLGSEPEILAERSEEIEDVPLPEEGLPAEISELFEAAAGEPVEEPEVEQIPALEVEGLPAEGLKKPEVEPGEIPAEQPLEELDFESLFGEEAAEELALPEEVPEAPPAEEEVPEEVAEAPPAEEELPEEFALPEEAVEAPAEEGPVEEAPPPEEMLPEEFALPEEAAEGEIPSKEEEAIDEFALAEGLELPEEEAPPPEEMLPEEFALPEEAVEAPAEELPEEEAPPPEEMLPEEFALPEEAVEAPAEEVPVEEAPPEEAFEIPAEEITIPGVEVVPPGEQEEAAPPEVEIPAGEVPPEGLVERPGEAEEEPVIQELEPEQALGEEELQVDEFSLQGLGEEFGISEEEEKEFPEFQEEEFGEVSLEAPAEAEEEIRVEEEKLELSEEQFASLKNSLNLLPRNLKIVIQELIGEKNLSGESLHKLVDLLVEGAAPAVIAAQVSGITGERIVLPKRFEKRTALAFEEERRTFAYAFRENIFPIIRVFVLSLAFIGLLVFLGYSFIYRPLYANSLYRRGYEQIENDRYTMANESFQTAVDVWAVKNWFYRYAEAFIDKKQFLAASGKYNELLAHYPGDHKGILDYAHLESRYLSNYEKADRLLDRLLDKNIQDYDALLAKGDNYLEWAEEDPVHFEDARFSYASILDYHGREDEVLFRMLKYFIRTDQLGEVQKLKSLIEAGKIDVRPQVYAELGGYLFDKKEFDDVPDTLFKAMEVEREIPEIHYHLARYFRYAGDPVEEVKAIRSTINYLEASAPLNKKRMEIMIDSYNRFGESLWRNKEYLDAEDKYQKAKNMIEVAQDRRIFGKKKEFGKVYENLGDIYYYIDRNLETSLDLYRKAEENFYNSHDLDYKIGYIDYMYSRYEEALLRFSRVIDDVSANENTIFSLANTLYQRDDYFSAQGYYLHLLDILETKRNNIPFLRIQENPEHRAIIEYILKTYNNLGVTLKKLSDRTGDKEKNSKALVNLTFSSENFDILARDPETLSRGLTKNLAFLNQRGILYPASDFELQIYNRIPKDLKVRRF